MNRFLSVCFILLVLPLSGFGQMIDPSNIKIKLDETA